MTDFHQTEPCDRDNCRRAVAFTATRSERGERQEREVCGPCAKLLWQWGWDTRKKEEMEP